MVCDIANTIMSSIGFDTSVVNKEVYVLKSTEGGSANSKFRFPILEKTIAAFLWRFKAEIEMALKLSRKIKVIYLLLLTKKSNLHLVVTRHHLPKIGSEEERRDTKRQR